MMPPNMPVNTRPRVVSFALQTLTSAVACAVLLSPAVQAAGLGKLTVLSSLGQPLRAEIELTSVAADEAAGLVAKLAPADAFRSANIDFNPTLLSLRFAVEQRNGRQFIRVTSAQPVNEPFVDMLLELSWNSGRLVREYTFLLDPADMRQAQSAQVAAPLEPAARAASPAPAPAQSAQSTPPSASSSASQGAAAAATAATAPARPERATRPAGQAAAEKAPRRGAEGDYRVKSGDTLSRIASQVKPGGVSLDVMLVALYRANPEAFSGKNMNRLRSGRILAVPDADTIRSTSEGEARDVIVAHAADFAAYRNKLAGQVAQGAPSKTQEAGQSAAGKISAKVEERATAANESQDQLKLSKAAPAASAAGKTAVAGVEEKIAKEKQVAEAAARVQELEKNVSDLEKLMAVKNKALQAAASASAPASAPQPEAPKVAPKVDAASAQPVAVLAPLPKPKPVALVKKPPVLMPEPSILGTVMENLSSIGIALAAVLAGVVALVMSRRKKKVVPPPVAPVLGDPGEQAHSLFAETGGQSVDTNNSVFNSNFAPSASQLDTNEVDPVAEADVYIAYGRDAQAEEILKEALRTHPERHPVRLKLMEIYATRKDTRSFELQAGELYAMTKGQGDEWLQAAALGLTIDPLNPLYSNAHGGAPAAFVAPAVAAAAFGAAELRAHPADADFDASDLMPATPAQDLHHELDRGFNPDLSQDLSQQRDQASGLHDDYVRAKADQETALPTPPADTGHFLDFDLGGLSFEPVSTTAPIAMPAPEPEPAPKPGLNTDNAFDMAFDMPFETAAAKAEPAPAHEPSMDFGLDLEPDATSTASSAHGGGVAQAPGSDPLTDLDLMNFDLPPSAAPAPAPRTALDDDLTVDDFFAKPAAPATQETASSAPEFDLSGIDLDLGAAEASTAQPGVDDPLSAIHMEMDTKLDLAIAYQEIGDKEGARELIDEVIKGGSDMQVAKANSMRALLG